MTVLPGAAAGSRSARATDLGGPAVSDRDLDAEFARIIAGWDDEAPDPQPHGIGGAVRTDGPEAAG